MFSNNSSKIMLVVIVILLGIIIFTNNKKSEHINVIQDDIKILNDKIVSMQQDKEVLLKQLIYERYPILLNQEISDIEKVNILRTWAHENLYWNPNNLLDSQEDFKFYTKDAASIFSAYFEEKGGVLCGGAAQSLMKLYEIFGFESHTLDMGKVGVFTHVVTLVKIKDNNKELLVVQDPLFDLTYVDLDNHPYDYSTLINTLKTENHELIKIEFGELEKEVSIPSYESNVNYYKDEVYKFLNEEGYPQEFIYLFLFPLNISDKELEENIISSIYS